MTRLLRAALTQTVNVFTDMPTDAAGLPALAERLEDIRRANLDHHKNLIAAAAAKGAKLICLGELFCYPYFPASENPLWKKAAEDAESGRTLRELSTAAAEHEIVIVAPIYELDKESATRYSTAVVLNERGLILGRSRKCHIPAGRNELGAFFETGYFAGSEVPQNGDLDFIRGDNPYFPVFNTVLGDIGVCLGYDRHFPEVIRALARAGAELILAPGTSFGLKAKALWEMEFQVEAGRNRVFIGGANRLGAERPWNRFYFGSSLFVDPNGKVLPNKVEHPNLVVSDLHLESLTAPDSAGWNLRQDARPDIYS